MSQETVAHVLSIEHDACKVYEDAQLEASLMLKAAERTCATLREQALTEARQQAERILKRGREAADAERAIILAHAGAEAQSIETQSTRHFNAAVQFVLDKVAKRR